MVVLCLMLFVRMSLDAQNKRLSYPFLEPGIGLLRYTGDQSKTKPSFSPSFSAGYRYGSWSAAAGVHYGLFAWNKQDSLNLDNFQAEITAADLRWRYHLNLSEESLPIQLFAGIGIGNAWFSSYTDAKDSQGRTYIPWSDGTLRNLPEIPDYQLNALKLKRDYRYETPLAVSQTAIYVPIVLGFSAQIDRRIQVQISWESILLQSDNLDRNTSNAKWDRLNRYTLALNIHLGKRASEAPKEIKTIKKPIPYEPGVDPDILLFSDSDRDQIVDLYDLCPETPEGVPVDVHGCPFDQDQDGIPDFRDKEIASLPGSWVDEDGVTRSDEWIQQKYNDSLAWFTQPLRKVYKNCRPYPVKKFIPPENYEVYARMLEKNPDWRIVQTNKTNEIPQEFRNIDRNNDQIISLSELHFELNRIFYGKPGALSMEAFHEAIRYAFEKQN